MRFLAATGSRLWCAGVTTFGPDPVAGRVLRPRQRLFSVSCRAAVCRRLISGWQEFLGYLRRRPCSLEESDGVLQNCSVRVVRNDASVRRNQRPDRTDPAPRRSGQGTLRPDCDRDGVDNQCPDRSVEPRLQALRRELETCCFACPDANHVDGAHGRRVRDIGASGTVNDICAMRVLT